MKVLLDTHAFLWFVADAAQLSSTARQIIQDPANDVLLSIASAWEMAIKVSVGKLTIAQPLDIFLPSQLQQNSIALLGIDLRHVLAVASLPCHHRDPFDRLLVAQALSDQLILALMLLSMRMTSRSSGSQDVTLRLHVFEVFN